MKVTRKDLESLKGFIESITGATLKVDHNHLGYALHVLLDQGGVNPLINGRYSKPVLYDLMQAFIKGFNYER